MLETLPQMDELTMVLSLPLTKGALSATSRWVPNVQTARTSKDESHPVWQLTGKLSFLPISKPFIFSFKIHGISYCRKRVLGQIVPLTVGFSAF